MVRCTYEQILPAPAPEVWAVFSRFGEIDWLPGPERVETSGDGVGMTRFLHIPGLPAPIEETLESLDEENRRFSYRVKKNPFVPYDRYLATVRVQAADAGCLVKFESSFALDPETLAAADSEAAAERAAQQAMSGFYQMMANALAEAVAPAGQTGDSSA